MVEESGAAQPGGGCANAVLAALPEGGTVVRLRQSEGWVLAVVRAADGVLAAGMAGVPHAVRGQCCLPGGAMQPDGKVADHYPAEQDADATTWARMLTFPLAGEAAVGLAVTNALLATSPEPAAVRDGVDWLLSVAAGRAVAVVGGFPFVDRSLRSVAGKVWVLERDPAEGELHADEAAEILPQADFVVITGSALANHTLDGLLDWIRPETRTMLLGPSTALCSRLFAFGFEALSGVRVRDVDVVAAAIAQGVPFRRMPGLERVTLFATNVPERETRASSSGGGGL